MLVFKSLLSNRWPRPATCIGLGGTHFIVDLESTRRKSLEAVGSLLNWFRQDLKKLHLAIVASEVKWFTAKKMIIVLEKEFSNGL